MQQPLESPAWRKTGLLRLLWRQLYPRTSARWEEGRNILWGAKPLESVQQCGLLPKIDHCLHQMTDYHVRGMAVKIQVMISSQATSPLICQSHPTLILLILGVKQKVKVFNSAFVNITQWNLNPIVIVIPLSG